MTLPNSANAVVEPSKIANYLLAFDHPEGASKAEFFTLFGFTQENPVLLCAALLAHANTQPVIEITKSAYGTKYRIEGPLSCPDGRTPRIRSIWILDIGSEIPRLVTAYPLE